MSTTLINFDELLEGRHKEVPIPVVIHNMPDPDAISSGMALRSLLIHKGYKPGPVLYSGEVSDPQNRSMVTLLNLDFVRNLSEYEMVKDTDIMLVDTNNIGLDSNQQNIDPSMVNVLAVLDHHKGKHP